MYYDVTLHLYILVHLQREGEKKLFIYVAYISIYVISPDITGPLRQDIPQQKAVTSPWDDAMDDINDAQEDVEMMVIQ